MEQGGMYVCALRAEPYQDGFLISGLETHPEYRRKGYAKQLVSDLIVHLFGKGYTKIYSHIRKNNLPSISLHTSLGFEKTLGCAKMLDGSVLSDHSTYIYIK
jgi:ribosomal protein S18 acetylase RimI-like enzyme